MRRILGQQVWTAAAFVGVAVVLLCAVVTMVFMPFIVGEASWRRDRSTVPEATSPLPRSVVKDLCAAFSLDREDERCRLGAIVYGPDFFPEAREALRPGVTTFGEVNHLLGKYEVHREDYEDGYFRIIYDFRGDGAYVVGVTFDADGVLNALHANVGDAWP